MRSVADSSPPPKMPSQRLLENDGFTCRRPSNYNLRKLNRTRTFPENCGAEAQSDRCAPPTTAGVDSPSNNNVKCTKLEFTDEINEGERKMPIRGSKQGSAIPAVPLRSLPPVNMNCEPRNSVPVGKKGAKENENESRLREDSWKNDSEKLAAILSEAKSYLDAFDVKFSSNLHKRTSTRENNLFKNIDEHQTNSEDYEDEISVLSPGEWNKSQSRLSQKSNGAKRVKYGLETEDIDCESIKTKSGEKHHGPDSADLYECVSYGGNNDPLYYNQYQKDLINMSLVKPEEPEGFKVMEALRLFDNLYNKIAKGKDTELGEESKTVYTHLEVASHLRSEGKCVLLEKPFGHVPGVEIGNEFRFRSQLSIIGLHRQLIAGIDHVTLDGKKFAVSVIDSVRYDNASKTPDVLVYSGQGGNPNITDGSAKQKLERGNLALMNSKSEGYPVRVTLKRKSQVDTGFAYVYDGLYTINNVWQEKVDETGNLVFKFELHRMPGQPRSHWPTKAMTSDKMGMHAVCISDDISCGKEKLPIREVNEVDGLEPPPFVYITRMVYPKWYERIEPAGCDCVKGCSDSRQCPCVVKNGGEIPYNESGAIMRRKPMVYECGPSCGCPPACMNRVSQRGPPYRLEIFKTECLGWGVRSPDLIPSGGFVCEYLGELLRDKDADLRVGHDEYLFDIYNSRRGRADGFAIDGAVYGNVGRFINHSCSPNVYAQDVCYDHADKRIPRVMFFATRDIRPWEELAYDYNYKPGTVLDANGNIKTKPCYCGSRKCRGRLY